MTQDKIKNTTILFVDDEADFRNALSFTFQRKGYKVFTASSGNEAFDIIRSNNIDVVVSDIQMPNGNGLELLNKTKEQHLSTPIILLVTGFTEVSTESAHNQGAEALFSKPFDANTLQDSIERLLTPPEKRWSESLLVPLDMELKIELEFQNLSTALEAQSVSIGRGGMFITMSEDKVFPNINDQVHFKIIFKENDNLSGNGIVRWIRTQNTPGYSSGIGLEFTYLSDKDREKITSYINSKKLKTFIPNK